MAGRRTRSSRSACSFPLSLLLVAGAVHRLGHRWQAATELVAGIAPIGHIANVAEIAVPVNIALLVALGSVAIAPSTRRAEEIGETR